MSGQVLFRVRGVPAPQGSSRAYVVGGRAVVTSDSKRLGDWRTALAWEARAAWGGRPALGGPAFVRLSFTLPRPKGHLRRDGSTREAAPRYPAVRPDLDKLVRACFDALTDARIVGDDAAIVHLDAAKHYGSPGSEGVEITVSWS